MKGKVLITGATSGLGLAYAKEYASRGYDLIVTGRRKEKLEKNMQQLAKENHVVIQCVIVELSNEEGLMKLMEMIQLEKIEVLINNAGFGLKPLFVDVSEEDVDKILYLQTNVVTKLTHFVLQQMKEYDSGVIINVASDGALMMMPHNVLYGASKNYILAFTQGLYTELYDTNIKVQVVCPSFMDTDFHESAGMKVNKSKKGLMKFSAPSEIVNVSMRDLEKGRVICKPTFDVKLIDLMVRLLPRRMTYKIAIAFAKSVMRKKK